MVSCAFVFFFFFNDTATTEIYTLSLHDALPIFGDASRSAQFGLALRNWHHHRSEEHTSELQSRGHLVCRLLLEKKKKTIRPCISGKTKKETESAIESITNP